MNLMLKLLSSSFCELFVPFSFYKAPLLNSTRLVTKLLVILVFSRGVFSEMYSTAPYAFLTSSLGTSGLLSGDTSHLRRFLVNLWLFTSSMFILAVIFILPLCPIVIRYLFQFIPVSCTLQPSPWPS